MWANQDMGISRTSKTLDGNPVERKRVKDYKNVFDCVDFRWNPRTQGFPHTTQVFPQIRLFFIVATHLQLDQQTSLYRDKIGRRENEYASWQLLVSTINWFIS